MDALTLMDAQLVEWEQRSDRRRDFLRCYRMMTGNMFTAIEAGEFQDSAWVGRLLELFAGYYFRALEEYEQSQPTTPAVWSCAHGCAAQAPALLNVLQGINAHINYDLVLALYDMLLPEWATLSEQERGRRYADHCHVNEIIGRTMDLAQDEIVDAETPMMDLVDRLLGPLDEWSAMRLICRWREEVWEHALELLVAKDEGEREGLRRRIQELTLRRSQMIAEPVGWLRLAVS